MIKTYPMNYRILFVVLWLFMMDAQKTIILRIVKK